MIRGHARRRVIWNRSGNPVPYVSAKLNLEDAEVSAAIHAIKAAARLRGSDHIVIYDNGDVTDAQGEEIGNIHDED